MDLASIVVAVLALGVLVVVHEAGHFAAAKWGGMKVSRFSVGFGPSIYGANWRGTWFQVGAIPFGGYVMIDGMHPEDGTDPNDPSSFSKRPRHLRAAAILAGPVANYILAFVMLFVFYLGFATEPLPPFEVLDVRSNTPAERAGLQKGDILVGAEGKPFEGYNDLHIIIQEAKGKPVSLDVKRGETSLHVSVAAEAIADDWLIGIGFVETRSKPVDVGLGGAITRASTDLVKESQGIFMGLMSLVSGSSNVRVSGPLGIVKGLSSQVKRSSLDAYHLVARLSIMLGFFNLLPIPALDGARLLFLGIGAIRRREVEPRLEAVVHGVGFTLLLGLMIVVSWFDLIG